ncbi:MAG TPA: hypothetical protein VFI44_09750 [Ornithinibacter sp.]|nr:hypothetical protein [Ornithinibacter sp.]
MSPALDERTAPDTVSGAVPLQRVDPTAHTTEVPPLSARDFWRAVGVTVLATLTPWSR